MRGSGSEGHGSGRNAALTGQDHPTGPAGAPGGVVIADRDLQAAPERAVVEGRALAGAQADAFEVFARAPGTPLADAEAELGLQPGEGEAVVKALMELSLLVPDGAGYRAVNPELAEAQALGAEELELAARRGALEARRALIRSAQSSWMAGLSQAPRFGDVDVVENPEDIANVLMHYAKDCRDELLSVHPGRVVPSGTLGSERMQMANSYSVNQGVRSRLLYQDAALRDRSTRAHLDTLAEQGARVRVAASLPGRSLVVDGKVALLPIPSPVPEQRGLAVVRQPTVVQWVIATFEQLWAEAIPIDEVLGGSQPDPEVDRTRSAILRLLAEGEKDEAISRRLAISVRTTRRHIAEYMSQVGANSRFQAGVIAARTGHLDLS